MGVYGKSLFLTWVLRFRGGWGGGEVLRDLSVPLSPKSTPQSDRGVPWAPSPLLNRQFLGLIVAVLCCLVCPRNTGRCSDPCCPSRNRPCPNSSYGGSLFPLFPYFAPGQDKIRLRFPHRTRLVLCPHRGNVVFRLFLGAAFLSNFCGVLPRPTKICLAFLRPALCAWRFCVLVPPLRGSSWVLGFGWPEARCVSSLSLVSCFFFCCVCFGAATLFLMPRPLLG